MTTTLFPKLWIQLYPGDLISDRLSVCCKGKKNRIWLVEAPKLDVVSQWITADQKVYSTDGPSETTCIISYGKTKPGEEFPRKNPMSGVEIALVDEDLQECDHGEVLTIGLGLAAKVFI
jgi:hypothetical protein